MKKRTHELLEEIKNLEIVDTHEHLSPRESNREKDTDFLREYLSQYFSSDLVSAGLSKPNLEKARDTSIPIKRRWKLISKYWNFASNTGYGRALNIAAQEIYDIEGITGTTIEELNKRFLKLFGSGEHYYRILKEKSNINISLLDSTSWTEKGSIERNVLSYDEKYFLPVYRIDSFLFPTHNKQLKELGKEVGLTITSIDDWDRALATKIDRAMDRGAVALKCGVAYKRNLNFEKVSKEEAEREFNKLFTDNHLSDEQPGVYLNKTFQDYTMHYILSLANERGIPLQVHTGIQEGNGNFIYNSEPSQLTNLFGQYPEIDFDIFHISYPYQKTLGVLAKNFPNVYIDMCWSHIISPKASVRALVEWLDSVPLNKISAFGGDYKFVDGVYAHQLIARENVAKALGEKIKQGVINFTRAKKIAEWFFARNPKSLFNLE